MVLIRYNEAICETLELGSAGEVLSAFTDDAVNWLNLDVSDHEMVRAIGDGCGLHHMLVEDIVADRHLPKLEEFDLCCSLSLKMLSLDPTTSNITEEQLTIVLSHNRVITFQEEQTQDVFDPVRDRILNNIGRIRKMGSDYLLYRLLDAVVSEYMKILEHLREQVEVLEEKAVRHPNTPVIEQVTQLKKKISPVRKYLRPLKDEMLVLKSGNIEFVRDSTRTYLTDVYDNLVYLCTSVDAFQDLLRDLMELQMAAVNHSTNEVMKTLTIMSSVFIPLTFIVGIYGMNFDHMPELHWRWGYPLALGSMIAIALGLWSYMRRRKWV